MAVNFVFFFATKKNQTFSLNPRKKTGNCSEFTDFYQPKKSDLFTEIQAKTGNGTEFSDFYQPTKSDLFTEIQAKDRISQQLFLF